MMTIVRNKMVNVPDDGSADRQGIVAGHFPHKKTCGKMCGYEHDVELSYLKYAGASRDLLNGIRQDIKNVLLDLLVRRKGVCYEHHGLGGHRDTAHVYAAGIDHDIFRDIRRQCAYRAADINIIGSERSRRVRMICPKNKVGMGRLRGQHDDRGGDKRLRE